ncbi:MAG: tRNA preQ1(34) S-adenosylmethionine ribosyltransferase-isomerase QueA [Rhizobiales bacterium]|nr:tRNA preQ1(34) S-adenosylmethionine ribosyltransferase-isomerase QueA [Hyphomicrobiales bacterium]NRB13770.1 tRNA preQ1(34) S-adenosylmethionine ribosyltransferase-isomerase QueA [Hyphomicrobiales bacterium]
MRVDEFDFTLPEKNIALRPVEPRHNSKLLRVNNGKMSDHHYYDLPELLRDGDVLVLNDTKVIPARMQAVRTRGEFKSKISVTLHMKKSQNEWVAFAKPAKRVKVGEMLDFENGLSAEILAKNAGELHLKFNRSNAELDAAIALAGEMPLPPYIASKRDYDDKDVDDYQTIYAQEKGAVAAPTAGLHFTDELFAKLKAKNIELIFLTLHVGAGTFLPMVVDDTEDHVMHAEYGLITKDNAQKLTAAKNAGRRIVAVGTTSLRLLESAANDSGEILPFAAETDIFITPGYRFKAVDVLLTNFHLPKSTLFMLVSAFTSLQIMQQAYKKAIETDYRFYSYGDSCLLEMSQLSD